MEANKQMETSAVPAESLRAAVLKAATAVKSCADSILSSSPGGDSSTHGDFIDDPHPASGGAADVVSGIMPEPDPLSGPCATEKGGKVEVGGGRDVVVPGENGGGAADEVVVPGTKAAEGKEPCVDALQVLDVGAEERNGGDADVEGEERDEEEAIVVGVI